MKKLKANLLADGKPMPVNAHICGDQLIPLHAPALIMGTIPPNVKNAFHAEGAGWFFLCADGYVYMSSNGKSYVLLERLQTEIPFLIEDISGGKARAVVIDGSKAITHTDKEYMSFSYGADLSCGVMHCGRLFGADRTDGLRLCWSGEGGINDWAQAINGSGSIVLDPEKGVILDILEYGEKLVIVRKFGLTLADMFGSPENFSVQITDTGSDEIYKGTARVVGGKLIFCTASGLHSFDGTTITRLPHRYAGDISSPVCSAELDGRYYLSCTSSALGRAVLCYDAEYGESCLIQSEADALCTAGYLYAYNSSGIYRLAESGQYYVKNGKVDFGTAGYKTMTGMLIDGGICSVEVNNGRVTRTFSDVSGLIRPRMRGKNFTVKISGNEAVKVTAEAEARDEV